MFSLSKSALFKLKSGLDSEVERGNQWETR